MPAAFRLKRSASAWVRCRIDRVYLVETFPVFFVFAFALVIGLALGSFTTCVVHRIPRKLSIWRNDKNSAAYRSFCPNCKTPLTVRDLIPVFSWLVLRGRCRHCGKPIGISYLMIEVGVTLLVLAIVWLYGFSITSLILCVLIPVIAGIGAFFALKPRL